MLLDFNPATNLYVLRVPRGEADPVELMTEYGLDLSTSAGNVNEAVLFTADDYAAATFGHIATPRARERLAFILEQIALSWAPSSDRNIDVPDEMELWPFQRASVDYALSREHALIGDEPGLGKTPIAIACANEMQAGRVLVVCPASIRFQWKRRIEQWSTLGRSYRRPAWANKFVDAQTLVSSRRGVNEDVPWTVISWDLVRSPGLLASLAKIEYDLLILDEAHYAKTRDAGRTQAIFGGSRKAVAAPLASRARRVLALTGTPLPNRPREIFALARPLCWEAIGFLSEQAFNERYNPVRRGATDEGKVYVEERVGREAELQNRLRANFMVRHLKREVMPQLKLPVYDLIRVEETKAVKAALEYERLLDIDPAHLEAGEWTAETMGHIATARKMMGIAMAPQAADYLQMLIEGGEDKLVVFAWHIEVVDILVEQLHPYGVVRVDGKDSAVAKDRKVRAFIERPDVRLIIGNVLSLGTGTDGMQHVCTHGLLVEPDWVNGNNQQCADRLDRGGQQGQVQFDIFCAPGSLAEHVLVSALEKGKTVHKALDRRVVSA